MVIASKQVKTVSFSFFSPEQIKKMGVAKIVTPELYDTDGYPVDGGLMDLRLGAIDPGVRCRTCGGKLKECLGHFGFIEMARPILHVKYVPIVEVLLRSTCQKCGRILVSSELIEKLPAVSAVKKAKDMKKCAHCKAEHEKIKLEKPSVFYSGKNRLFPNEIRERLERITDDDYRLFGFNPKVRPEWFILTLLLVPPVTVRPSITLETGERSEDDLTHKLGDIVRANQRLWENLNAGAPEVIIEDLWDLLQYHVTTFFDNTISQVPPARHRSGQPLETITERIKGKEGRIRHNLAGKRVNFSSRTVISPDPRIGMNEVGIPLEVAKVLTIPEKVTSENIEMLKKLVLSDAYPGANYIIRPDGKRKRITEALRKELLDELTIGYTVERHLKDGDIVLFNRHPSLHKHSLMGHYIKILPGLTFRLHPGTAPPYNADFDGDEMNIHVPQTEEAKAESEILLNVNDQLISAKNNSNEFGCVSDAITGNYLLSLAELSKEDAVQLLAGVGVEPEKIEKARLNKTVHGREIFSVVLPKITFARRTKACKGQDCPYYNKNSAGEKSFESCKREKCPFDAYLSIKDGELLSGTMGKNSIGVEDGLLLKEIDRQTDRKTTMSALQKIFSLGITYLTRIGFTISLDDVKLPYAMKKIEDCIAVSEKKAEEYIEQFNKGTLESLPGRTKEETREIKILQTLNEVRSKLGVVVKEELPKENPANVLALSGASGSLLPILQMACCVGQQSLWARRIDIGYTNRTLSFFKPNDLSPITRGFVRSSFFAGLKPYEFFYSAITGRDGLMDTALRTPKSGYLYRRLANALQDLKQEYDGTVRDATGRIIQYAYGGDNKDVTKLHLNEQQIESGEAIGIVTAQSFGQPSTQMTLNVFHFAGISEMQVTTGLPRLIEIFDARKKPSTPTTEIYLHEEYNNEAKAKEVAEKIKAITVSDVAKEINILFSENKIEIKLDRDAMRDLRIRSDTIIRQMIEKEIAAKIKDEETIAVKAGEMNFKEMYKLKEKIKKVLVSGIEDITQVLIVKRDKDCVILTAGTNLVEIMKIKGVDKDRIMTNDLHEIERVFGIEAARQTIMNETQKVISKQGFDIDKRHIMLIADAMTTSGDIKGITRMGIINEKSSVLARASFETPIAHFVEASLLGSKDELRSVIENIMLNQPVPVGTGLPGLLVEITGRLAEENKQAKEKEK